MPPKRKAAAAPAAGKRKKAPAPDWRVPLFYWRGEWDEEQKSFAGTWVASEDGPPSADEFATSANTFKLVLTPTGGGGGSVTAIPSFIESSFSDKVAYDAWRLEQVGKGGKGGSTIAGLFEGKYKLDNGDGPEDYSDHRHEVHSADVISVANTKYVAVVAKGTTEFGDFVSMGVLVGTTLTLARRYIDGKDPRKKRSLADAIQPLCDCKAEPDDCTARFHSELLPWKLEA
jgi:hypothetical protein